MNTLFTSIISDPMTVEQMLVCTVAAVLIGLMITFFYERSGECTKSFAITITLLPVIIEVIIILVNGDLGAGVAVAGAFSLVRFRSAQGRGNELTVIFLAMSVGIACGMGYIALAALFAFGVMAVYLILSMTDFGEHERPDRVIKVSVPENVDYDGLFDDILLRYTRRAALTEVRTGQSGTQWKLTYTVRMRRNASLREMLCEMAECGDDIKVSCARPLPAKAEEL